MRLKVQPQNKDGENPSFQSVKKVKQKCLAFSLICGIINMVMKGAENRKTRKTSDRICMYGRADTGRPSAQKNR